MCHCSIIVVSSMNCKVLQNNPSDKLCLSIIQVKERGKDMRTAYKGIRSKLRDMQPREGLGSREDGLDETGKGDKPQSAPTSPVNRRRPHTFTGPKTTAVASFRKDTMRQRKNASSSSRCCNIVLSV